MFSQHKVLTERLDKWLSKLYWADINLQSIRFKEFSDIKEIEEILVYEPPLEESNGSNFTSPTKRVAPSVQQAIQYFEEKNAACKVVQTGDSFGPSWSTKWFRLQVRISKVRQLALEIKEEGKLARFLQWDSNSEALLYDYRGLPIQGFTGGGGSDRRDLCFLLNDNELPLSNRDHEIENSVRYYYVEMACNGMFGNGGGGMINAPDPNRSFTLSTARIVYLNTLAEELLHDMQVLFDLSTVLAEAHPTANAAISLAMQIMDCIDLKSDLSVQWAHNLASAFFHRNGDQICRSHLQHEVYAVGHCHIDTAWLWPYRETRRKVVRSWCSQLHLMKTDPVQMSWKFVASQSVHWDWLQEDEPELFGELLQHVRSGRIIPIGSSYVEFDANLPSGESMVRQFLYGSSFFKTTFSTITKNSSVFWLPDTFGYAGQLPQIMLGFGLKYFVTQKLSWNLTNKFPHSTFYWEGIDGSRVLCHFPPADTYNSAANAQEILRSCENHKNKTHSNRSLLLFGHGDGGGGPTSTHLANLVRLQGSPGMPVLHIESSPDQFFSDIEVEDVAKRSHQLPVWVGELYLELHQGTLTSQANIKKQNRQCENLMRAVEALLVYAVAMKVIQVEEVTQKQQDIRKLWKDVLLNQFHDVLPGSSIGMVYDDSYVMLSRVLEEGGRLSQKIMSKISQSLFAQDGMLLFNPISCDRHEIINNRSLHLPPFSFLKVSPKDSASSALSSDTCIDLDSTSEKDCTDFVRCISLGNNEFLLENAYISVTISAWGQIWSILDKRVIPFREVIDCGSKAPSSALPSSSSGAPTTRSLFGNMLMLYDDVPFYWDAWDIFPHHLKRGRCINSAPRLSSDGAQEIQNVEILSSKTAVTVCVTLTDWGDDPRTSLTQRVTLNAFSTLLDFDTSVSWFESHKLLKVEFPVSVRSTFAAYDIQFGVQYRPTHANHTTDAAQFEVCGHKFADLSEPGYGVALMNNCKYGYSCRGSVLCLSLLRAPKAPVSAVRRGVYFILGSIADDVGMYDENCDIGEHAFKYALFPHVQEGVMAGKVAKHALIFNNPLITYQHEDSSSSCSSSSSSAGSDMQVVNRLGLFAIGRVHRDALMIDAMKLAEDATGDIILRVVEVVGSRGVAQLLSTVTPLSIQECGMDEVAAISGTSVLLEGIQPPLFPSNQEEVEVKTKNENGTGESSSSIDVQEGFHRLCSIVFEPFQIISLRITVH